MDTTKFFSRLDEAFPGDPRSTDPVHPRWAHLAEEIPGSTAINALAVLNLAAQLMPVAECYVEVGTRRGRSLAAATQDVGDKRFYGLDSFGHAGHRGLDARAELDRTLSRYAAHADTRVVEGDAFRTLARRGVVDRPVGVYFYDGPTTGLAHHLALAVIEPHLADEALVFVADSSRPKVQQVHGDFLAGHRGWSLAARWDGHGIEDNRWGNGLHALVYRRPAGSTKRLSAADERRRRVQVGLRGPLASATRRVAHKVPPIVSAPRRPVAPLS
ncbi:MAG: class I SAM-dependent methyltransferase [Nostocoides sp.]